MMSLAEALRRRDNMVNPGREEEEQERRFNIENHQTGYSEEELKEK